MTVEKQEKEPVGGDVTPIRTGAEYIESLRGRKLTVYLFGEQVDG